MSFISFKIRLDIVLTPLHLSYLARFHHIFLLLKSEHQRFYILQLILDTFYIYKNKIKYPVIFYCSLLKFVLSSQVFNQLCKLFTNSLFFLNWHYSVSYFLVIHWHSSHFLSFSLFFFSLIVALNSSWLISMSINAWDSKVSLLSSLLLANIKVLSWFFFLFLVMLSNFLIVPVVREKLK